MYTKIILKIEEAGHKRLFSNYHLDIYVSDNIYYGKFVKNNAYQSPRPNVELFDYMFDFLFIDELEEFAHVQ